MAEWPFWDTSSGGRPDGTAFTVASAAIACPGSVDSAEPTLAAGEVAALISVLAGVSSPMPAERRLERMIAPTMMITARLHPIRSADVIRHKLARSHDIEDPAEALDLLINTITEGIAARVRVVAGASVPGTPAHGRQGRGGSPLVRGVTSTGSAPG